jgi:thiol:disulfide interchange protein DsbA
MAKKHNKVKTVRNTVIGFFTLLALSLVGYGVYLGTGLSSPSEISDSDDVREIENPHPRRVGDPITVVEFFSYTCIHCKNFDPMLEEWAAEQPDDVAFRRQPAMWSPLQIILGQTYLTLAANNALEENHTRIFRAIHDRRRQFRTAGAIGDYVDGRGISKTDFMRTFNSPRIKTAARKAESDIREFDISATPSIVVADRYVVGMKGGMGRALQVVDKLIVEIRQGVGAGAE